MVDETWREENAPHRLKLLPKRSCGGSYDNCLSFANSALSFMCRTNLRRRVLVGSYSPWPVRLRNCFLGAYKSVSSFWDVVPYSRRPSHEHAGSSCLLHNQPSFAPNEFCLSTTLSHSHTRIRRHLKTNAISVTIFSMRPRLCNMITPTGICRRPGVSYKLF